MKNLRAFLFEDHLENISMQGDLKLSDLSIFVSILKIFQ